MNNNAYYSGLLYLIHLLMGVDGELDENELLALKKIRNTEEIPENVFSEFERDIKQLDERDIFKKGIQLINQCSENEKLKAFVTLYKMSEVDGHVHLKEIKLLLYSIEMAGVGFDEVVHEAKKTTALL